MPIRTLKTSVMRLAAACAYAPVLVITVALLVVGSAALYLVQNLAIDTNLDELVDPTAPFRERQRALEDTFPVLRDRLVIVVDGTTLDARIAATVDLVRALEARNDVVDAIFAPSVMPFFERHALLFDDTADMEAQLDQLAGAQPFLARLAAEATPSMLVGTLGDGLAFGMGGEALGEAFELALDELLPVVENAAAGRAEPISWLQLSDPAPDTEPLIVEVRPRLDFGRLSPGRGALDAIHAVATQIEAAHLGIDIALTGEIALEDEELEAASTGAATAGLVSLVLVVIVLAGGLRSAGTILAVLSTLVAGLVLTAAFAMFAIGTFTMISIAFAVLFIGLGVDFAIHVVLRAQETARQAGAGNGIWPQAVADGAAGAAPALLLCAPTTALAFLSFTPTGYVGLAQLGIIAAAGMMIALLLALTLLPALLRVLGRPRPLPPLPTFGAYPRTTRVAALILALLAVGLVPFMASVRFDGDPLRLRPVEAPSVTAFEALLADPDLSPYRSEMVVDAASAAEQRSALEASALVGEVIGIDSFVPADQETKLTLLEDARLFLDLPEPAEAVAAADPTRLAGQLDRLAELSTDPAWVDASRVLADRVRADPAYAQVLQAAWFRYWPQALERIGTVLGAGAVTVDDLPQAIVERYVAPDGRQRLEILPAASIIEPEARRAFVDAVLEAAPMAAGSVVQMTLAADLVADAMLQASLLALVGVTLLVGIVLRRLTDTVAVMAAVLLAAALTLGVMGLLDIPFNFANVIVLPLLLGFGVDAAIHVVMRSREVANGGDVTATSTPRAVLLSALTTLASFGTLMISTHQGTASMGLLLTIAMLATLLASLIALPAWLAARKRN